MKAALFFGTNNDRIAADHFAETFAVIPDAGTLSDPRAVDRSGCSARSTRFVRSSTSAALRITFMLASPATT
jgi:hypothetical protein